MSVIQNLTEEVNETPLQSFKRLKELKEEEKKKLTEKYNNEKSLIEEQIGTISTELEQFKLQAIMASQSSQYRDLLKNYNELIRKKSDMEKKYIIDLQNKDDIILNYKRIIYLIKNNIPLPENYKKYDLVYAFTLNLAEKDPSNPRYKKLLEHKEEWIEDFNKQQEEEELQEISPLDGGSKSRRRHRRKPARKTRRGRIRKSMSKTHRRKRHSRVRKSKRNTYTRRR
jgi:hypothetical protein